MIRSMAYRRTERVMRRLNARREAILTAAEALAGEAGIAAVQIAPVAARAGIAAGTVYRYFPSKTELVSELVRQVTAREIEAMRGAAEAAPGPLSAIAAAVAAFAARALRNRRLTAALIAAPADGNPALAGDRLREALGAELRRLTAAAVAAGLLAADVKPELMIAPALAGALIAGLTGTSGPAMPLTAAQQRETVQSLTLLVLRALGVPDARARGLVVQTALPLTEGAA